MEKTHKEQVRELLNSIETGETAPVAYINAENYTQHNPIAADGLEGFGEVLAGLKDYPEDARVNVVRIFEDGDYVFSHTEYNFFGEKIGFDIFRFEDDKIVEHWDNMQQKPVENNPSGHSMTDGPTTAFNSERTEENKVVAEEFVRDILMGENLSLIEEYFDRGNLIQHNPLVGDGLEAMQRAFVEMQDAEMTMEYHRICKVLGEGNFVLSVSEGLYGEGGGVPTVFYDLFRVENYKIAEHWDVIEAVPSKEDSKNSNGKAHF
ncbi:MAG: nuclear transport factor 2 family protein [Rikenellaceae bacterium]